MFIKYGLLSSYLYLMYYNINRLNTNNISEITYGSIVGYYFGGFISGLVHWYFDTYDSKVNFLNDIHNNFRGHHIIPEDIIPTDYLTLLTEIVPITYVFFSISYLTQNQIIISSMIMTNLVGNLAQLIHKYSHQRKHENDKNEGLVAGTIMSIQEKKSSKGTPFAIVKFSDKYGEFELFLFAEILINNREKIKESESFILTLQKDKSITDVSKRRLNLRKILSLDDIINRPYSKVTIELKDNYNIDEIKKMLIKEGQTEISLIINDKNQKIHFNLENPRKFDFSQLKLMKSKDYVKKITV